MSEKQPHDPYSFISEAVAAVERLVLAHGEGKFKKQLVQELVRKAFPNLSPEQMDIFIELAVSRINAVGELGSGKCGCF